LLGAVYSATFPPPDVSTYPSFMNAGPIQLIPTAFGDVFFKESNADYSKYVFTWSAVTKDSMARFYPLIKTPPYLTAIPDIKRHQRSTADRFLILASDGVWGLRGLTNEWAVETVQEGIDRQLNPAEYMMEEVMKFRPGDDVTIVVVVFSKNAPKQPVIEREIEREN
jgi:serine/threonine protein phosphatase PrpC